MHVLLNLQWDNGAAIALLCAFLELARLILRWSQTCQLIPSVTTCTSTASCPTRLYGTFQIFQWDSTGCPKKMELSENQNWRFCFNHHGQTKLVTVTICKKAEFLSFIPMVEHFPWYIWFAHINQTNITKIANFDLPSFLAIFFCLSWRAKWTTGNV